MITKYIKGDITETELKYIAHGVNCQNKMGSGVAKALYEMDHRVKSRYHEYVEGYTANYKPEDLLGNIDIVNTRKYPAVINCFIQLNYGYDGKKYVNYAAIVNCFKLLKNNIKGPLAIPKIGCGLAGGDWNIVEQLINDTVGDDLEIWVYHLDEPKSSGKNDFA